MASFDIYLIYEFTRGIIKATSVYLLITINVFFQMFNGLTHLTSKHSDVQWPYTSNIKTFM